MSYGGPVPDWILVGKIGRTHGTGGELLVVPTTDREERFSEGSELYLDRSGNDHRIKLRVKSARSTAKGFLVIFSGYETRESARELTGSGLFIPGDMLAEPGPDSYYGFQLEGCEVYQAGLPVGRVTSLEHTRANPYLVVLNEAGKNEICIPFVSDVIVSVDLEARRIDIREGFLG